MHLSLRNVAAMFAPQDVEGAYILVIARPLNGGLFSDFPLMSAE
jgi:hypothetical protein